MTIKRRVFPLAVIAVAALVALAGCSSSPTATSGSQGAAGTPATRLKIVAGENFWGAIVAQLAGHAGQVTSIVTDPNADPHSYEASSDNARAFASADYVILNGAGYDSWADKLLAGNPNSKRKVFTVADLLGKKPGDNPHFWYNPDYVTTVTDRIEADLKSLDPADSPYFTAQRASFDRALAPVTARLATIKARFAGTPVASTESIFVYLAQYLNLDLISPPEFMQAVAEGNDPPAAAVSLFESQITKKQARVLVYNLQTSTVVTTNIRKLATQAGIPNVAITETIQPPNASFEQWFGAELVALENALAAGAPTTNAPTTNAPTASTPPAAGNP